MCYYGGKNMKPKFMIKYGKEQHLQQIVDGKLRFAPSQTYIKIEEQQHNRGQGDLLEGKMKIKLESLRLHNPKTNNFICELPKSTGIISIQDVNNIPIFCLSQYSIEDIKIINGEDVIVLNREKLESIKKDIPEATHALIIIEPEKFISDVRGILGYEIISDGIHYYDYNINTMEMLMFLTTGCTEIKTNQKLSMTYENRYRHLLCKDIDFETQQEYRFVVLNELITEPKFYNFKFTSKYMLIPIKNLKNQISLT